MKTRDQLLLEQVYESMRTPRKLSDNDILLINKQDKARAEKARKDMEDRVRLAGSDYSKLSDNDLLETYKDFCDKRFNVGTNELEKANNQVLLDLYVEIKKRGSKLVNRADGYEHYSRRMAR